MKAKYNITEWEEDKVNSTEMDTRSRVIMSVYACVCVCVLEK